MPNYQQAVPAVQKAITAIEYLRAAPDAPTLTELSRSLQVNRSTLLAVLNTLRNADWLVRDGDGRYRLGPAFLAFGPVSVETVRHAQQQLREAGGLLGEAEQKLAGALASLLAAPDREELAPHGLWRGSGAGGLHGAELERFLALPLVASLACLNDDGYPYTVPVWYEWREGAFWLVPRPGARWISYVLAHPRVSMTISESSPPFRRVLVEGRAEQIGAGKASRTSRDVERRMARRYLGSDASRYLASSRSHRELVLRISVDKMTSWEGLVAHPRYQAEEHALARHPA